MSLYPTPYTLRVRSRSDGPPDGFGNPTDVWTERDWHAIYIVDGALETEDGTRDLSVVMHTIGAPPSPDTPGEYDQVLVDGEWCAVNGRPKNWTRGPFGFAPGVVVELRKAEG